MLNGEVGKVALVFRGTREGRAKAAAQDRRQGWMFEAMAEVGLSVEPAVFVDDMIDDVREQLLGMDGVLVWVNPMDEAGNRDRLDELLREVSSSGVWVSTHPDVILQMGTKKILHRTRSLSWDADTHLYATVQQLRDELPARLAQGAVRVLKQCRGNGGIGVYRVSVTHPSDDGTPDLDTIVTTQHARAGSAPRDMPLGDFMARLEKHFGGEGRMIGMVGMIDQCFQERLQEGMIRCYMVQGQVVGFGHQRIRALLPPPPEGLDSPAAKPGPRIMSGADAPDFQALRQQLESEWIPGLQRLVDIPTERLPAIWDADFLRGPRRESGEDTYVLCEINVSAVFPFPDEAIPKLAQAAASAIAHARRARKS